MPAWLRAILRAFGIRSAADVVPVVAPVVRELAKGAADAVAPKEPSQPLSHADVRHIQDQIASSTQQRPGLAKAVPRPVDRGAVTPPEGTPIRPPPRPKRKDSQE